MHTRHTWCLSTRACCGCEGMHKLERTWFAVPRGAHTGPHTRMQYSLTAGMHESRIASTHPACSSASAAAAASADAADAPRRSSSRDDASNAAASDANASAAASSNADASAAAAAAADAPGPADDAPAAPSGLWGRRRLRRRRQRFGGHAVCSSSSSSSSPPLRPAGPAAADRPGSDPAADRGAALCFRRR